MDISSKKEFDLYKDIQNRTDGEVYLGIVGPVRTGKSTFIKRFMDLMVLPYMEDVHSRQRTIDELPQSAQGKTIMTTEPKFIPKDAAEISLEDDTRIKIRLIDCVGFMVDGAAGHMEGSTDRMVHTPWFDHEIPFVEAASIGTEKVIRDHATIGIVVTTDGSIGDLPRENYVNAEDRAGTGGDWQALCCGAQFDETLQRGDRPHCGGTSGKVPDGGAAGELRAASQR